MKLSYKLNPWTCSTFYNTYINGSESVPTATSPMLIQKGFRPQCLWISIALSEHRHTQTFVYLIYTSFISFTLRLSHLHFPQTRTLIKAFNCNMVQIVASSVSCKELRLLMCPCPYVLDKDVFFNRRYTKEHINMIYGPNYFQLLAS